MIRNVATALGRQSIAILALVVAVSGGTAYAAALWTGADIVNGSLTGADIANGSLTGADVDNGTLTGADVDNGTLTGADVENGSLDGADIANGSITASDLAPGAGSGAMAPIAAIDEPGPIDVEASSATAAGSFDARDGVTLATTEFTMDSGAFVRLHFTADGTIDPTVTCADQGWPAYVTGILDGRATQMSTLQPNGLPTSLNTAAFELWLQPGTHTISAVLHVDDCETATGPGNTLGAGMVHVTDLHMHALPE